MSTDDWTLVSNFGLPNVGLYQGPVPGLVGGASAYWSPVLHGGRPLVRYLNDPPTMWGQPCDSMSDVEAEVRSLCLTRSAELDAEEARRAAKVAKSAGHADEWKRETAELCAKLDALGPNELARRLNLKPLRRRRSVVVHCPVHEEHTASCSIDMREERVVWHCYGCGAGGGAVDLVSVVEGLQRKALWNRVREMVG